MLKNIVKDVVNNSSISIALKGKSGGFDKNAKTFITNIGITNTSQKTAINKLVKDLKAINKIQSNFVNFDAPVNSVIKALYPFIGGTATTHKFNLINPLDTDAAFRASFSGTITHDANGVKGDGVNGYFDTHINAASVLALNDSFFAFYALENPITAARYCVSSMEDATHKIIFCGYDGTYGTGHVYNSNAGQGYIASAESWATKKYLQWVNRYNGKYNIGVGVFKSTENTNTGGTLPSRTIKGLVLDNAGTLSAYENRRCGMIIIGKGLSDVAIIALSNACDAFQRNLNRYP